MTQFETMVKKQEQISQQKKQIKELKQLNKELLKALTIAETYLHNADRELKSGKTLRQIVSQAINKAL